MTAPMTDAEIREALARAERATCSCHIEITRVHGFPQGHRSDCARTDVPRLAADLLAARAERDEALISKGVAITERIHAENRRETAEARCRELEAERAIVADYLRDTDADFRARRPSERAVLDALLSPPPPHTCQIHRASAGASDCGLEPCEEAKVHTDRGEARSAENATPEDAKCATCGHEERRHLSEDGDGARWCDVALCDCVDYAALEVNRG